MSGPEFRWPHPDSSPDSESDSHADDRHRLRDPGEVQPVYLERNVLPLRDVVLFPNMITPLYVDHEPSLTAISDAYQRNESMIAITQMLPEVENPAPNELHMVGTEIEINRIMTNPDGSTSILTEARHRVQVVEYLQTSPFLIVKAQVVSEDAESSNRSLALMRITRKLFERCVQLNRSLPEEAYLYASNIESPGWLADLITSSVSLTISERQAVLEIFHPMQRLEHVNLLLKRELEVLELEDEIQAQTQQEFDRTQREGFLREQMKVIQTELGEGDVWSQEISELLRRQVKDPRLGNFVTITEVTTSADLRYAKVFVSRIGDEAEKRETLNILTGASGFLRKELAKRLKLRYIPELSFRWDDSIERSARLQKLLDQVNS